MFLSSTLCHSNYHCALRCYVTHPWSTEATPCPSRASTVGSSSITIHFNCHLQTAQTTLSQHTTHRNAAPQSTPMHVTTCQCVVKQMRGERSGGGLHTCRTHGAGPAAVGEHANSPRQPADCCARCDCAWGTTPHHSGSRAGLRVSIQGTCSEHRLNCRCSHRGWDIPGWLWSGPGALEGEQ